MPEQEDGDKIMKSMIIFDLHGTLAISRQPIDAEMVCCLSELLALSPIAVVSGSTFQQFERELLSPLDSCCELFWKLCLFPSEATEYYQWSNGWNKVYGLELDDWEVSRIKHAITTARCKVDFLPAETFGESVLLRGAQVTYAILGIDAPLNAKVSWDADLKKRLVLKRELTRLLPDFHISIGGHTSVNINHKGIGKVNCILELRKQFGYKYKDLLYIGNEFGVEGDDLPIKLSGVDCIEVSNPEQTKGIIKTLLVNEYR